MRRSLLVLLFAAPAAAQPADTVAAAEQLFNEARALFDRGNFAEACPKFDASYKLDPALGTLLNLATCYEKNNQLASAWGRYRELAQLSTRAGDATRLGIANERATALEPRLPKLTIHAPNTAIVGLVVTRDAVPVDPAVLGTAIYVDPGAHAIVASAPGHVSFETSSQLAEAEAKDVQVPDLALVPVKREPPPPITREVDPGRNRRLVGLALGGVGVAVVGTGLGFGVAARSSWNSAFDDELCDRDSLACTPDGQARTEKARDRARLANFITGAGVAAIAAGAIVYFTAPKKTTITVTPGADGGTVSLGGHW